MPYKGGTKKLIGKYSILVKNIAVHRASNELSSRNFDFIKNIESRHIFSNNGRFSTYRRQLTESTNSLSIISMTESTIYHI